MGVTAAWRSGAASDPGQVRETNEDRFWVDDERGMFLVVDGLGGHAAGDKAADIAVETVRGHLEKARGSAEERVRGAIALANNVIYRLARDREEWRGMACVLTLALVENGMATIGHVGDSRLYLLWNGGMRKLTSDHSPVGEREDQGEISEEEAMLHPRRNEVYRDVGSMPREPRDPDFVEIRQCRFKPDAALLLCTDGLSDALTAAEIAALVEDYDGDPCRTARELVNAANDAGGRDNITAVFVAGPDFLGHASEAMAEARARHAITRARAAAVAGPLPWFAGRAAFLAYGLLLGALAALALQRFWRW